MSFAGPAVDGPLKGQLVEYFKETMPIMSPMVEFSLTNQALAPLRVVRLGSYVYDDKFKYWKWEPA